MANIEAAVDDLDVLIKFLGTKVKPPGFDKDHKDILWLIKAWIKIAILANHPDYHKLASAYLVMKRDPAPYNGSRVAALLRDIDAFQTVLERDKTTHGDFFDRVDRGLRDFVWSYRKGLSGKSAESFEQKLLARTALSKDQVMKEKIFPGEQEI